MEIDLLLDDIPAEDKKITLETDEFQGCIRKFYKSNGLNILLLNIQGIKSNIDKLLVFLESSNLKECDLLIFTECHKLETVAQVNIPGFEVYYDGADLNRFDGIIIYTKNRINPTISTKKLNNSKISITNMSFKYHSFLFSVNACYRSPNSNVLDYLNDLDQYLSSLQSCDVTIFMGDININILGNDNIVDTYFSQLYLHGFVSSFKDITRPVSGTCIDHVFVKNRVKKDLLEIVPVILNYDITDHLPILLNISPTRADCTQKHNENLVFTKLDYDKLIQLAASVHWDDILEVQDPEAAIDELVNIIVDITKKSQVEVKVTKKNRKLKPWITNGLITSIRTRDRLKKSLKINSNPDKINEYKIYRNKLNKLITERKNNYYKDKINQNSTNIKQIYTLVQEATNENNLKKIDQFQMKTANNDSIGNDLEVANLFNDYFINVGRKMADKINSDSAPLSAQKTIVPLPFSMFLKPISQNEVIEYISSLKNKCSPGKDGIDAKTIKALHPFIIKSLTHILNATFNTGCIPHHFKTSIVRPVHKSGSKSLLENYRPISVMNNFGKIFEKCLKERLVNYMDKNHILSNKQFGFTSGLSTEDALQDVVTLITKSLDTGKKCLAVFLDLSKAFDSVSHSKLLGILENYGIRGNVLKLFKNYFESRVQYTKINNCYSNPEILNVGVPQGTVLGPILFKVYVNLLFSLEIEGEITSFADDTTAIFVADSWDAARIKLCKGLLKIKRFLDSHKLSLNMKKTKYIAFSITNANRPDYEEIVIDTLNDPIKAVSEIKYLGIMVDQHLRWDLHALYLTGKIRALLNKFYLLRTILTKRLLLMFYKSLIEPILRYGISVWGGACATNLEPLKVMQNTVIKIMLRKPRLYPTAQIYSRDLCNLKTLHILASCLYIKKTYNVQKLINHNHQTRINLARHIIVPPSNRSISQHSLIYLGPKFYNLLPNQIKKINTRKKFINETMDYIFENQYLFSIMG